MAEVSDHLIPDTQLTGLGRRAVSSALVLSLRRFVVQLVITGSGIVLARLLFPDVFGVFAIISFLVLIFSQLTDIGFTQALIQQKEEPSVSQLKGVFTAHVGLGVVGAFLLWLLAPALARLYGPQLNSEAVGMLRLLGLVLPLASPGVVSRSMLQRELRYTWFAIGEFIELTVGRSVAIVLAVGGFGIASLVVAELAMRLAGSFAFLLLYPWPVGLTRRFAELKSLFSFGLPFQVSSWVGLVNAAVVPLYIGNFPGPGGWSGAQAVGFVSFAAGIAAFSRFFSEIIGQLIFPVVSRAQTDLRRARISIERSLEVTALTTFGLIAVVFALSREVTSLVYTEKWLPAVPLLRLQLLQSVELALGLILMNGLLAFGASRVYLWMHVLWAVLQWALTVPLVGAMGFVGLGWASLAVSATSVFLPWMLLRKKISFAFFSKVLPTLLVSTLTLVVTLLVKRMVAVETLWTLLLVGGVGGLFYAAAVLVFLRQTVVTNARYLWTLLRKQV